MLERAQIMFATVPSWPWPVVAVAITVTSILMWSVARRRLQQAGECLSQTQAAEEGSRRSMAWTIAAMVPAVLFWAMVLAGSFHGLVGFGRDTLGWHDGWEYLVSGAPQGPRRGRYLVALNPSTTVQPRSVAFACDVSADAV